MNSYLSEYDAAYWTGGNDLATKNRWVWTSRGNLIYPFANWLEGQPVVNEPQQNRR